MSQYTALSGTTTTYANALTAQDNCLYHLNDTDVSGYVFELGSLDLSSAIATDPSFGQIIHDMAGISNDCSGVIEFTGTLADFQGLFSIQIDSDDIDDVSSSDVKFRINAASDDTYNDISDGDNSLNVGGFFGGSYTFSGATVKTGNINTSYSDQDVKHDFVRHLAYEITGGYSSSDIFTNEATLISAVSDLDAGLNTSLNSAIDDMSGVGWQTWGYSGDYAAMINAAFQLYNLNIQVGNAATSTRMGRLLADIAQASTNKGANSSSLNIPLRFSSGDRLAIRIVYHPASATFSSNNASISERSYKVFIKLE